MKEIESATPSFPPVKSATPSSSSYRSDPKTGESLPDAISDERKSQTPTKDEVRTESGLRNKSIFEHGKSPIPAPRSPVTLTSDALLTAANGKTLTPTPSRKLFSANEVDFSALVQLSADRPNLKNNLVDDLELEHECPVCCSVLRYPVKFDLCDHHCCAACFDELFRFAWRCPVEQRKINKAKVNLDKAFQLEIDDLAAKCINLNCKWLGSIKDIVVHLDECKHRLVPCPNGCDMMVEKRRVKRHGRKECVRRWINCEFCGMEVMKDVEFEHVKVCPKFVLSCPNECKKSEVFREDLKIHLEKECPNQEVPCPFMDAGCEYMGQRKHLRKHYKEEPIRHLGLACNFIVDHKHTLEKHEERLLALDNKGVAIDQRINILDKQLGAQLVWKVEGFAEKFKQAKSGFATTLYSPPFNTSKHGYRMMLSMCLFGDGKGRGTHVSLFASIVKGLYDAFLEWPFKHRITLTLLDQNPEIHARRNVQHSIKPNICTENDAFIGRPMNERNASFGVSKFVEIDSLKTLDYVMDDNLFIKCTVDLKDMVKL